VYRSPEVSYSVENRPRRVAESWGRKAEAAASFELEGSCAEGVLA
jgi:hypothetical protein